MSDPFAKHCSADDSRNWSLNYDRRLLRDIRTISGGVMVVNVTAVGRELLYKAEPTEGSIYSEVSRSEVKWK